MRHHEEPIYSQSGGYRIGRNVGLCLGNSWPFARFHIYDDRLVIRILLHRYVLKRKEIKAITLYTYCLWDGIQIHHTTRRYPPFIAFSAWNIPALWEKLRENGFPVTTSTV